MARNHVVDKDLGMKNLLARLNELAENDVFVGIQSKERPYKRDKNGNEKEDTNSKLNMAEIATIHEFGSPAHNIPQRSFLRSALDENKDKIYNLQVSAFNNVVKGMEVDKALNTVGNVVQGMVQQKIVQGPFEPNAPATIKKKGSTRPLIDTGHMRQSVRYLIDKRGSHELPNGNK